MTARYLLALVAAVIATALVATSTINAVASADFSLRALVSSIASGKPAKAETPLSIRAYTVYYVYREGRWIVEGGGPGLPLYAVAIGQCPPIWEMLNKTFTAQNNTVYLTRCSIIFPAAEARGNTTVFTHVVPMCDVGTDFRPETAEESYIYANMTVKIRAVLVWC